MVMKFAGVFLFLLLAVTACSGKPYVVKPLFQSADAIRSHQFFVVNHGWHTGLIIYAKHLNQTIPELKKRFGNVAYYEIGWGDKGYYQAEDKTLAITLRAMFLSEGSVIHVVAVPYAPGKYFGQSEVVRSCLTDEQISSLVKFISTSFARDSHGRLTPLTPGLYGNSRFYDGKGRFSLLNTCNTWTAKGLQSGGVNISPSLSLTAGSIMNVMRELQQQCTMMTNSVVEGSPPGR